MVQDMRIAIPSSLLIFLALPALAAAQSPVVEDARRAFAHYDVDAESHTLQTLADLRPVAEAGDAEAAYMRAVAGTELYAASVALHDAALTSRVARALGVDEAAMFTHLAEALDACRRGPYAAGAADAVRLLGALDAFVSHPEAMRTARGPHRDALLAIAIVERPEAARIFVDDPCSAARSSIERGVCDWDEPSRRTLAAMREALAALDRAGRARDGGDPLLALLSDRMTSALTTLRSTSVRPWISGTGPDAPGVVEHGGSMVQLDAIAVVTETEVRLRATPIVRLDARGALVWARSGEETVVAIPTTLPPIPQAIDELVAAAAQLSLPEGATVGLFPSATVPAHVLVRADLSLARGQLRPTHLVAMGPDGAPVSVAFRTERENDAGTLDARVRILMGGYGLGRGSHGRESRIPRVRDASGLAFDVATLAERLSAGRAVETVALDAMGTVPSAEVVRVAFATAAPSRSLILLLP